MSHGSPHISARLELSEGRSQSVAIIARKVNYKPSFTIRSLYITLPNGKVLESGIHKGKIKLITSEDATYFFHSEEAA